MPYVSLRSAERAELTGECHLRLRATLVRCTTETDLRHCHMLPKGVLQQGTHSGGRKVALVGQRPNCTAIGDSHPGDEGQDSAVHSRTLSVVILTNDPLSRELDYVSHLRQPPNWPIMSNQIEFLPLCLSIGGIARIYCPSRQQRC